MAELELLAAPAPARLVAPELLAWGPSPGVPGSRSSAMVAGRDLAAGDEHAARVQPGGHARAGRGHLGGGAEARMASRRLAPWTGSSAAW